MRADKLKGSPRYALFVPKNYDPKKPTPLVIGLHGGGAGGADGKLVVGAGWHAMSFYLRPCNARDWICACPTALRPGWDGSANDALLDALLDELRALFNIDENRIYLVGHSMGGAGVWAQGPRRAGTWAAVAAASSYNVSGIRRLLDSGAGIYVYHSDDDPRVPVADLRRAMEKAAIGDADLVLDIRHGFKHAFPQGAVEAIFAYFDKHARGQPRSSFLRPRSMDERRYLPPLAPPARAGRKLNDLLQGLRTGGGVAARAVAGLVACKDAGVAGRVARALLEPGPAPDVRRFAAQVLGERHAKDQLPALGRALRIEPRAEPLLAVLDAIAEIDDPAAGPALVRFVEYRVKFLQRRVRDRDIDYRDWVDGCSTLAQACSLLGRFKPPRAARTIAREVVGKLLLGDTWVLYDRQAELPLAPARAMACFGCRALAELGEQASLDPLQRLLAASRSWGGVVMIPVEGPLAEMGHWPRDPRISACAREALEKLRN